MSTTLCCAVSMKGKERNATATKATAQTFALAAVKHNRTQLDKQQSLTLLFSFSQLSFLVATLLRRRVPLRPANFKRESPLR